jgi:hypothetical protein
MKERKEEYSIKKPTHLPLFEISQLNWKRNSNLRRKIIPSFQKNPLILFIQLILNNYAAKTNWMIGKR